MNHYYRFGYPYFDGKRKGQACEVLWRGKRNSALIVFEDGTKAIVSRFAVRKVTA